MTKYEEMPLDTIVKPGDRLTVTITVPESGCWRVTPGIGPVRAIERPVPEVELPTVPGYYEAPRFPLSEGCMAYRLNADGVWTLEGEEKSPLFVRAAMPLTLLVPETEATPAKLADRLDVDRLTDKIIALVENKRTSWEDNATDLIDAIDNGELDK